jgi:hypothetical protein
MPAFGPADQPAEDGSQDKARVGKGAYGVDFCLR